MRIRKFKLQQFRNHRGLDLEIPDGNDLIVLRGDNGAGKTSVLEAFYYASFAKSFRSRHLDDLIFWDNDYFRLEIDISESETEGADSKLELFYSKWPESKKVMKLNELEKSSMQFLGYFKSVIFTPRDILMLTDEPSLRRSYLNKLLIQTNTQFLPTLSSYQRVLRQRNAFLKKSSAMDESELAVWDEELATQGSKIVGWMEELTEFLGSKIQSQYREISDGDEKINIEYRAAGSSNPKEFKEMLIKSRSKDLRYRVTHVGPHRDDLLFFIDDRLVKSGASQGELRSILLALKLTEAQYIESATKKTPILLFDDVLSELDPTRQKHLIENLSRYQVFITAAEKHCLDMIPQKAHVIEL